MVVTPFQVTLPDSMTVTRVHFQVTLPYPMVTNFLQVKLTKKVSPVQVILLNSIIVAPLKVTLANSFSTVSLTQ